MKEMRVPDRKLWVTFTILFQFKDMYMKSGLSTTLVCLLSTIHLYSEMESEDWLADFGLTNENTAMEQFNAQVKPLGCSEECLTGLASIKVRNFQSDLIEQIMLEVYLFNMINQVYFVSSVLAKMLFSWNGSQQDVPSLLI